MNYTDEAVRKIIGALKYLPSLTYRGTEIPLWFSILALFIRKGSGLLLKSGDSITWPLLLLPGIWTEHQCLSMCLLVSFTGLRDGTIPTGKQGPAGHLSTHSAMGMSGRKYIP